MFYDAAFTQRLQKERDLNALFEGSLENGDFQVYLQPKVWVENGSLGGAEALVRWNHPRRGMIYPSDFIPLFEKNGKICRLDFYVFEEVCRAIHRWARNGMRLFPVSVNLSRQHFDDPEVLLKFKDIADRYEIPAGLLELELTESIFFDDQRIENVKHQIRKMHRLGFRCSLDDFGAGYSSLGLLMEFDVDAVQAGPPVFPGCVEGKDTGGGQEHSGAGGEAGSRYRGRGHRNAGAAGVSQNGRLPVGAGVYLFEAPAASGI